MNLRKRVLIGSVSAVAIVCASAPAFAQGTGGTVVTTGEVVVTGIRESLQRAIQVKKESFDQVDAVSATDIGKLPDKNIADALQRVPGVNTQSAASGEGGFDENDRVSIRGTSPSLANVTVDGHNVSTGDWFILDQFSTVGRSISFDLLPAEIVQGIEVYKTQDASLVEGGVAGSIDIITRKPLDFTKMFTEEASVQGAYNSISGQTKPQINGLFGWKSKDDTLGVLVQGFYEDRSVERHGQETLGYFAIGATSATGMAIPALVGVQSPTLIGSSLFQQEKRRAGIDGSIQWRPTDKFELRLSGFYSDLNATNHNDNYMYWGSNEIGTNVPTSYTVKNNTLIAATFPANGPAGTPVNGLVVDNIIRPNAAAQTYYYNLDGKYVVNDKLTIKGQIGYTHGLGNTPTEPAFEVDGAPGISYKPSGNGWAVMPSINPQSPAGLANDWAWNEVFRSVDSEIYGKVDGEWDIDNGVFKEVLFGARAANHTRQVDGWDRGCSLAADKTCFGSGGPLPFSAVNPTSYPNGYSGSELGIPGLIVPIAGNPNSIVTLLNNLHDGVHGPVSSIVQPLNYYWPGAFKVQEQDTEGYVMAKVGGEGWRGNFGVRIADTMENSYVNSPNQLTAGAPLITTSAYGNYYVNHIQHDYLDVLPSANFTFDVAKDVLLRVSAAQTMSRPDFSALGGTFSISDLTLSGNGGNANLKPVEASVYDGALEWYYAPSSIAAVSLFYDDFSSYVTFGTSTLNLKNQLQSGPTGNVISTYTISSPFNIPGKLEGIELQVQQPIAMGFGFQANYTYIDSEDQQGHPLVGTSKDTFNVIGYFENKLLSARLAYTYRSHFYVGLDRGASESQDDFGQLDASLNVNVTENIALTLDAKNITDNLLKYYAATRTQPRAVYDNGTQVFFGMRAKF